jgi:hypothetical protein
VGILFIWSCLKPLAWYRNFCFLALVQESGSFQTTQKVPKKSDFFGKNRISQTVCPNSRNPIFLGKIGFLKPCTQTYHRSPIFLEKSDFSNRAQGTQEIRFFGKIGFLKPCAQTYHRSPIFWKNRISQTVPKVPKKSDFFGKNRISFEMEWSGNFRFRVLGIFSTFPHASVERLQLCVSAGNWRVGAM